MTDITPTPKVKALVDDFLYVRRELTRESSYNDPKDVDRTVMDIIAQAEYRAHIPGDVSNLGIKE